MAELVPDTSSVIVAFSRAELFVPNELKYGLHQLSIIHGQYCHCCIVATKAGSKERATCVCPLEHIIDQGNDPCQARER